MDRSDWEIFVGMTLNILWEKLKWPSHIPGWGQMWYFVFPKRCSYSHKNILWPKILSLTAAVYWIEKLGARPITQDSVSQPKSQKSRKMQSYVQWVLLRTESIKKNLLMICCLTLAIGTLRVNTISVENEIEYAAWFLSPTRPRHSCPRQNQSLHQASCSLAFIIWIFNFKAFA